MKKRLLTLVISAVMILHTVPVWAVNTSEDLNGEIESTDNIVPQAGAFAVDSYIQREDCMALVNDLGMSTGPGWQFGSSGKSFVKNGFKMEYIVNSNLGASHILISMESTDKTASIYGVTCGITFTELNDLMKAAGWGPCVAYSTSQVGYLSKVNGRATYLSCSLTSDQHVKSWIWCNWPQGDFSTTPFSDMTPSAWYYDAVNYVYQRWIMTGMTNTYFGASQNLSRGQFACVLYRLENSPAISYSQVFSDVPDNQFYTSAVIWARRNGIINGYSNGKFGPADNITREQLTIMMYNYARYKGYNCSETNSLGQFPDRGSVSAYALPSVKWAVGAGMISGDRGNINPQGNASRAQCASIMMRFLEHYK